MPPNEHTRYSTDERAVDYFANSIHQPHRALYRALRKRGASWSVEEEYDANDLFVGAAVTLGVRFHLLGDQSLIGCGQDDSDLKALAGVNGVKCTMRI